MHQTKPTTKSRHTNLEENNSFKFIQYQPTASTISGEKFEPQKKNRVVTHKESHGIILNFPVSFQPPSDKGNLWEIFSNRVG
jgi:hypothetical protein